jgi:MFS family permease
MSGVDTSHERIGRAAALAVVVAALGYFVDIYDLLLYSIVRVSSLKDLGLGAAEVAAVGERILQTQMFGMLLGGILWGVLGDRRGRLSVLFGSIVLYSGANIANGFVHSTGAYELVRFVAGLGLAGELGAGITLVSELMPKQSRGWGTAVVAAVGICGAIVASLVGRAVHWRTAYFIGGGLGVGLLFLRVGTLESGLFKRVARGGDVSRGNFLMLFRTWPRTRRYLSVVFVGTPIWYVVAILVTFSLELGRAMGMSPLPNPADAVMFSYAGLVVGDFGSGALSQVMRSRKRVVRLFLTATVVGIALYFTVGRTSLAAFYACCAFVGVATGYWAVFVTMASEQFGTNIRATVTTTAPNFVRGAVVLVVELYKIGRTRVGAVPSAIAVGALTLVVAYLSLRGLEETYGKDLDFVEE